MSEALIILSVIMGLIGLILAFVFAVHAYVYLFLLWDAHRLRLKLKESGRVMTAQDAADKIKNREGLIIVDAPTLGWNVSRIWWSAETDFSPRSTTCEKDAFCAKEDAINYERFISPSVGCAKLVSGFVFSQRIKAYLKKHFALDDCPFIFTGGVLFKRQYDLKKSATEDIKKGSEK